MTKMAAMEDDQSFEDEIDLITLKNERQFSQFK